VRKGGDAWTHPSDIESVNSQLSEFGKGAPELSEAFRELTFS